MTGITGSSVLEMKVCTEILFEQLGILRNSSLPGDSFKRCMGLQTSMESSFLFFGCLQILFRPSQKSCTKYYHSSLDASITLAVCLCVLQVRLGKCLFGESIVEKIENLIN